jgi:hypothetical protein
MALEQYATCIEACNTCADACDSCATACLQESDSQALARCIALDIDCAQACRMVAGFMARGSEMAAYFCKFCEEMCEACGEEAARHSMAHCQKCAEACRRCAAECRRMAVKMPGARAAQGASPAH